jgi:hypothetical protein
VLLPIVTAVRNLWQSLRRGFAGKNLTLHKEGFGPAHFVAIKIYKTIDPTYVLCIGRIFVCCVPFETYNLRYFSFR